MPRYQITPKAGRFVAGRRNTGVGTVLELSPQAAEFDLRNGALAVMGAEKKVQKAAAPAPEPTDFSKMTKAELEALAEERGVDLSSDMKKAEMVAAMEAAAAEG